MIFFTTEQTMSDEPANLQVLVHCNFCNTPFDVVWKCLDCTADSCQNCIDVHLEQKPFRSHRTEKRDVVNPSTPESAFRIDKCTKHPLKFQSAFCDRCDIPICVDCIVENHQQHPLTKIHTAIQRGKDEIERFADRLENEELKDLEDDFDNIEGNLCEYDADVKTVKTQINTEKESVMKDVEDRFEKMFNEVESSKTEIHNTANDFKGEIYAQKGKVRNAISRCRNALLANDSSMIHYVGQNQVPKHKPLANLIPQTSTLQFEPRQTILDVGRVVDPNTHVHQNGYTKAKILKSFQVFYPTKGEFSTQSQYLIKASDTECWLGNERNECLFLYNDAGNLVNTMQLGFQPYQIQLEIAGNFLICDFKGLRVVRMTEKGDMTTVISNLSSHPTGICINHEGMVVLGMRDVTKLHVYSQQGDKVGEIGSMCDGNDAFTCPSRIVQNGNLDYCVRNAIEPGTVVREFRIITIDKSGMYRWVYSGIGNSRFCPFGVCCDLQCNVIICDMFDKVHLVDKDGKFIRLLLTKDDGICYPFGIESHTDGTFWMGQGDGTVHIVKFLE